MPDTDNDLTSRPGRWRRLAGDDWAAFDALPPAIRARARQHAYDPWAVNLLALWRLFRRQTASTARAERRLLNHLDKLEALERQAFAEGHARAHGAPLPHQAAGVGVLRA
jgi:hypothetical protein